MSHEAVTWAMDDAPMLRTEKGRPDTTTRGVLQVLAEHADRDGRNARPSLARLRYRTGYDRRTVQRALRRLETAGLIKAVGTHGEITVYALALHTVRPASDWTELLEDEQRQKDAARDRQRKSRAKRAASSAAAESPTEPDVTHPDDMTEPDVTHPDNVTEPDVTHSDDERHASGVRDVTHSDDARHALSAALTVSEPSTEPPTTLGDGRRPTTGSGGAHEGGSAAAAKASPTEEETKELRTAAVGCVLALMPTRLRDRLPNPVPTAVVDAIRTELARGLTADQLVERVGRRWQNHGYENDAESADGPGILRPVGVAIALVRRGQCTSERCDDGTDVDTGARCRTCEREAEDRKRRREAAQAPVQGTILVGVPSGATDAAPAAPRLARRLPAQRTEIRDCERGCGSVHRTVPAPAPAGLCPRCTADDARAANG
ncbi:helix-turn-helix domain-containing protein [Streptomyces diastaticus]|uniref:helix-turn-helix domain-containing protein n=1 Tax=Streptomyces diastaticus TaxID=1956 RepID=UPI003660FCFE